MIKEEGNGERKKPGRERTQASLNAEEALLSGSTPREAAIESGASLSNTRDIAYHLRLQGYRINPDKKGGIPGSRFPQTEQALLSGSNPREAAERTGVHLKTAQNIASRLTREGHKIKKGKPGPARRNKS